MKTKNLEWLFVSSLIGLIVIIVCLFMYKEVIFSKEEVAVCMGVLLGFFVSGSLGFGIILLEQKRKKLDNK